MELIMIFSLWLFSIFVGVAIEGIAYWRGKLTLSDDDYKAFSDRITSAK
ncbi:MAG: hypothetical protein LKJ60_04935 [Lentilactobacillus buchneri]|jgi:hypothetical protein|nr:hypothetical protein [Lentilactobacillus buchneri]